MLTIYRILLYLDSFPRIIKFKIPILILLDLRAEATLCYDFILLIVENNYNTIRHLNLKYGLKPVLIQRILLG